MRFFLQKTIVTCEVEIISIWIIRIKIMIWKYQNGILKQVRIKAPQSNIWQPGAAQTTSKKSHFIF